jgi:hypothetical protein
MNAKHQGSNCVSMTWRALLSCPLLEVGVGDNGKAVITKPDHADGDGTFGSFANFIAVR